MKRIVFLLTILLSFISLVSIAQGARVTFGDIPLNTIMNGEKKPPKTTSSRIIAIGKISVNKPGFKIVSYEVSIISGSDVWGPVNVHGAELTPAIIEQIKKTKGPNVKIMLDDVKIKDTDGMTRKWNSIVMTYDE